MKRIAAKTSLADEAAGQIRKAILDGRLIQGERLRETGLAETLGISRGPVREAFKLLKAEGLVFEVPNRGTYVVSLSTADVGEIYEVRLAVETRAAKLIARAAHSHTLSTLRDREHRLLAAAAGGKQSQIARADVAFHEAICRASGVGRLHQVFLQHVSLLYALLLVDEYLYPVLTDRNDEHSGIVRALESGDEARASAAVERHLEDSWKRLSEFLDARPEND